MGLFLRAVVHAEASEEEAPARGGNQFKTRFTAFLSTEFRRRGGPEDRRTTWNVHFPGTLPSPELLPTFIQTAIQKYTSVV